MAFGIYQLYRALQPEFRQRRIKLFLQLFHPQPATRILDVGGYVYDWDGVVPIQSPVTFLNLNAAPSSGPVPRRYTILIGDGRKLPFPDQSFDIAFSNSVIEHVGTFADQQRFAAELRRVAKQLFVQTPNRWFFLEPHFLAVFVHFLPRPLARRLLQIFSFRGLFRAGDNVQLNELAEELRLLGRREMERLFPDCEIRRETWFGLTKSFIAVRRQPL